MNRILALAVGAVIVLAGCANNSPSKDRAIRSAGSAAATAKSSSSTPSPEELNITACADARSTLTDAANALDGWNGELVDVPLADKFRTYATELFAEEVKATGSVKDAIHATAKGLTQLSIALDGPADDAAVGAAAVEVNADLAQIKGVCGY